MSKPYKCETCEYYFPRKDLIDNHDCEDVKSFECKYCGVSFSTNYDFCKHAKIPCKPEKSMIPYLDMKYNVKNPSIFSFLW